MSKLLCYKLRKKFGKKLAVEDVSISIDSGRVIGILGPNGAGKTTIFNMMLGLVIPDSGHIFKDAKEITNMPVYLRARNGITYLAQESSIFTGLSVEDNLRLVLENFDHSNEDKNLKIKTLLSRFGLISMAKQRADSLSGGEKRRLEIARMMTLSPNFLLLDEPFGGVDPMTVKEIQRIIIELKGNGLGIIITDHSVERMVETVDEMYVIHKGKILSHGLPETVLKDENVVRNFLGE